MSKGHTSRGTSKYANYGRSSAQNQNVVHVNTERLGHRRESNTPYSQTQEKDIKSSGSGNRIIDIGEKHRDRDRDSSRSSKRHSKSLVSTSKNLSPSKNQLGSGSSDTTAAGHNRDKDKDFINRIVEKSKKHLSSRRNSENNSREGLEKSGGSRDRGRRGEKTVKGKGNSSISSTTSSSSSGETSSKSSTTSSSDSDDSSVPSIYKDKPNKKDNKKKRKDVLASESTRTKIKIKPSPSSSSTTPTPTKTDKSNPIENRVPKKEQFLKLSHSHSGEFKKKTSDSFHNSQHQYQQQKKHIDSYGGVSISLSTSSTSGVKRDTKDKDFNEKDYNYNHNRKCKLVDEPYNNSGIKKSRTNNMDEYPSSQMKYKTAPPRRTPSPHQSQRRISADYPIIGGGSGNNKQKYDRGQASKRDFPPSNSNNYDERYNSNPNSSRNPPPLSRGGDRDRDSSSRSYANSNLYSFSQTSNAQPSPSVAQSSPRKHLLEQHHRGSGSGSIPIDGISSKNRSNNPTSTSTTGQNQNRSGIDSKVKKVDSKIKPLMEEEFSLDRNLNKYKTQLVDQKRVTTSTSLKRKHSPLIVKTKEELMEKYEELNKKSRVDLWVDQTIKGSDIEPPEIAKISSSSLNIDDFKVKENSSCSAGSREKAKVDDLEEISDDDDDGILEKDLEDDDDDTDEVKIDESKLQIPIIETERISADELEINDITPTPTPTPTLKSFQQNKTEGTASVGDSRDLRSVQSQSQTDDDILERMNESFESISDDDDIINDQQKFGIIDTLGIDWASLVCRDKSEPAGSMTSNNVVKASLKERWNPLELIKQVGISKELCGEELFQNVVHKISELNQMKRTSTSSSCTSKNPIIVINDTNKDKDTSGLTDDTNNDSIAGSGDDTNANANVTSKTNTTITTEGIQEGNGSLTDDNNQESDKVVHSEEDSNNKIEELPASLSLEEIEKELERPILRKRRLERENMLRNFGIYSKILYARKDVFIKKYTLNAGKLVVPTTPTQQSDIDTTPGKPNLPTTNGVENLNNVKT